MSVFWKKQLKIRQAASVVVVVFYLIITSTVSLFHNEGCVLGTIRAGTADVLSSNEPCPACMFSAGFNSTEANHGLPQLTTEAPVICQPTQHFTIPDHHEWSYSILLRAPPLTSTS